nr:DUF6443 domain-containing protein [uncultured Flavobacterium sp.]
MCKDYIHKITFFLTFLIIPIFCSTLNAQYLVGPPIVEFGKINTYNLAQSNVTFGNVTSGTWIIQGGKIISQTVTGINPSVTILWNGAAPHRITFNFVINYRDGSVNKSLEEPITVNSPILSNQNYIQTITPTVETTDTNILADNEKQESVTYFDGLGRSMQTIDVQAGGNGQDIITHAAYDNFGRQEKEYLPYAETSNKGFFRTEDIALETKNFYSTTKYENTANPYSQKEFEASSLNRVLKQAAPGTDWTLGGGHEVKFDYQTNVNNDQVRRFGVVFPEGNRENPNIKDNGFYEPYQLHKTITKDENWLSNQINPDDHTTQEFKDKQDRIILKRTFNEGIRHDTYYIYDVYGNLTYVSPPLVDKDKTIGTQTSILGYKDFKKSFNQSVFSGTGSGGGGVEVTIVNNVLKVVFSGGYNASMLNTNPQDLLTSPCNLPDMELGTISNGNYKASIVGGKLKLTNLTGATSTGFSSTFTVNLPASCPTNPGINNGSYENFYQEFNQQVFSGKAGGGSVRVSIEDNILKVAFSGGYYQSMLDTPPQELLTYPCPLPDITLGNISNNDYSASIVGGKLKLTSLTGAPSTGFSSTFTVALPLSCVTKDKYQIIVDDLYYQYHYDSRNRLIEKKLPGKGWEYIVYDKLDRPVLTQDSNLRTSNKWLFIKYDAFNRPVYTGEYINSTDKTRIAVQALVTASSTLSETKLTNSNIIVNGTKIFYTNNAFPNINNTNINIFTINYYDDYVFDLEGADATGSYHTPTIKTKGLLTASKVRILGTNNWINNVNYYDNQGRIISNYSKNDYLTLTTRVHNKLDFTGKILEKKYINSKNSVLTTVVDVFTYDQAGRLTKQTQAINGATTPEVIAENSYDELGKLVKKRVGGKTVDGLQTVNYTYNIRGWLKGINDANNLNQDNDLFGFGLSYNTIVDSSASIGLQNTPLYNGNISNTFWKANNGNPVLKQYNYTYDALNRFKYANYAENNVFDSKFNEGINEYDRNGNIMYFFHSMQDPNDANKRAAIDYLVYTYNGNQLMKVDDDLKDLPYGFEGFKDGTNTNDDYSYDANGNMTLDNNKGITEIKYNHLNLPDKITFGTGTIEYVYDANGVKQSKIVNPGVRTDYANGFQYEDGILKFFPQPEGYVEYNNGNFNYIYQYKDHLGNVRLSYKDVSLTNTPSLQIVEENSYYPFGLKHKENNSVVNSTNPGQKYKYNGKELQDENIGGGQQLNWYDYGARNYDPALGRWMNVDPLAEKFQNLSPYIYALNNPLRFVDPDGKDPDDIILWGWDPALNKYRQTLVMKSNIYNINYYSKNIFAPMAPASRAPIGPTYMYGLDAWATLAGRPDAVRFNISAQLHAGGVNVGGTLGVVAPLKGPDKGGLFFYGPSNEKGFDINFEKASYSLEIDGALSASLIYKTDNNFKKFDRSSFEGLEASIGGNYGIFNASAFTASDKSYFGVSFGIGKSMEIFSDGKRGNMTFGLSGAKLIDYLTINPEMQN